MSEDNKQETKVKVIQSDNILFRHELDPVSGKVINKNKEDSVNQ